MPVSYICTMDPDVIDDKPGTCPICKMTLQPVRIESAYSCTTHPSQSVQPTPGKCRIDRRDLVPMVVNHFWDCGEIPERLYPDPGTCANGKARVEKKVVRAHGDHNPRHGGLFYMAEDKWHHLEGTYPRNNLLRIHFFDNFTQPLELKGISGRAFTAEENGRELGVVALRLSRDGKTLEAQIGGSSLPQRITVKVKFKPQMPENRFDFEFKEFSKEPVVAPTATTTGAAKPPSATTKPSVSPAAPASAPAVAVVTPPPAVETVAPAQQPPIGAVTDVAAPSGTMTRADATSLAQDLPNNTAELLKLLELRGQEVSTLIQEGNFGMVYVPTMLAKEVALALQDHISELPARQHTPLTSAVRRLVLASWRLDQYGDLGDREKISQAHSVFAAAAADIKAAYASR
jgi:hypothetical protein